MSLVKYIIFKFFFFFLNLKLYIEVGFIDQIVNSIQFA